MRIPNADHLHAIMAGNGNPYAVLTPLRKQLLRESYRGISEDALARRTGIDPADLKAELHLLERYSLLKCENGMVAPTFFIADESETAEGVRLAHTAGRQLADDLLNHWGHLESIYRQLKISEKDSFKELAFLLVGDLILDIGLLDALARDRSLMPSAPKRPSPELPEARYYFWLIEGARDLLGRYGQRTIDLPWDSWTHVSFGQYWIDDAPNVARDNHHRRVRGTLEDRPPSSPHALAQALDITLIERADGEQWAETATESADRLVGVYQAMESTFRQFYENLAIAGIEEDCFAEFFCWFDHVAYARAIDVLSDEGVLTIPACRFSTAILWEIEGQF